MRDLEVEKTQKIRPTAVAIIIYLSLTLFQTPVMHIGTISAFSTIVLVLACGLCTGDIELRHFQLNPIALSLTLFFVCSSFTTIVYAGIPDTYMKLIAQIVLCVMLSNVVLNEEETEKIKLVFCVAMTLYSALIIRSCKINMRYFHGDIPLFGTLFDPNYLGIPLVAAITFLLEDILKGKNRLTKCIMIITIVIAVINTASRSNMVVMAMCSLFVFIQYFFRSKDRLGERIIWAVVVVMAMLLVVQHISSNYALHWERMTTFGTGSDNGRIGLWKRAFGLWWQKPLLGNGYRASLRKFEYASHNTYLQVLTEQGLIGFALLSLTVTMILKKTIACDPIYTIVLLGLLLHIAFLDALDSRCVWGILCWFVTLPDCQSINEIQLVQQE